VQKVAKAKIIKSICFKKNKLQGLIVFKMERKYRRSLCILTLLLSGFLAWTSFMGAYESETYKREVASLAAQGIGQDIVNLFLVIPSLLVLCFFIWKKSKAALLIYGGVMAYVFYSMIIYCFGIHFNSLFLAYCVILGLSFYGLVLFFIMIQKTNDPDLTLRRFPTKVTAAFLLIVSAMFYALWLSDIVPAILNNEVPESVSGYNLLVNPVHVIDIAIALPALILTAIFLLKKQKMGFILAPVFLVFIIIMAVALAFMVLETKRQGLTEDSSVALIFLVLAAIGLVLLIPFVFKMKAKELEEK
jgi:hypothetical protein